MPLTEEHLEGSRGTRNKLDGGRMLKRDMQSTEPVLSSDSIVSNGLVNAIVSFSCQSALTLNNGENRAFLNGEKRVLRKQLWNNKRLFSVNHEGSPSNTRKY